MTQEMTNEEVVANFMAQHYTDERLAALLAHAEDGKLAYLSCCCFLGVINAPHALRGEFKWSGHVDHHQQIVRNTIPGAPEAERAFGHLGLSNTERRAALIPLIHAEFERRDRVRAQVIEPQVSERLSDVKI